MLTGRSMVKRKELFLLVILFAGRGGPEGEERGRGRGNAAH